MKHLRKFPLFLLGVGVAFGLSGCSVQVAAASLALVLIVILAALGWILFQSLSESNLNQTSLASVVVGGIFAKQYTRVLPAKFSFDTLMLWPFEQIKFLFPSGIFEVEFGEEVTFSGETTRSIVVQDKDNLPVYVQDVTLILEFDPISQSLDESDEEQFEKFRVFCQQIAANLGERNPFKKETATWRFSTHTSSVASNQEWHERFSDSFSRLFSERVTALLQKIVKGYTNEEISTGALTNEVTEKVKTELTTLFNYQGTVFKTVDLVIGDFSPSPELQKAQENKRIAVTEAKGRREAIDILADADKDILRLQTLERLADGDSNTVVIPTAVSEALSSLGGLAGARQLKQAQQMLSSEDQVRANVAASTPTNIGRIRERAIADMLNPDSQMIEIMRDFLRKSERFQDALLNQHQELKGKFQEFRSQEHPMRSFDSFIHSLTTDELDSLIGILEDIQDDL